MSKGHSVCLSIGRDAIMNVLGGQISSIVYYNISKWALKKAQYLSKLSNIEIEKLLTACKYRIYQDTGKVFQINESPNKVVIVLEGKVNGMGPGTLIGEEFFKTYLIQTVTRDYLKEG